MPEPQQVSGLAATFTVVAMGLGTALVLGDLNILSANISVVRSGLQFSSSTTSFVAVVATLVMAAAALGAGVLGDVYGMKRMFLAGTGGAIAFGVLAAAAPNVAVLIIARACSGVAFAFLLGLSLAIINAVFPPGRRAGAIAMFLAASYAFGVIPPPVGSQLVEHFGWRSGFLVAPVLAVLVAVITVRFVPETPRADRKPDIPGMVLVAVALLGLIYGISHLQAGVHPAAVVSIILGVVAGAAFVMWERHTDEPALDLRIFRSSRFNAAIGAGVATNMVSGGSVVVFAYYLVIIRSEPSEVYALLLIPATLVCALAAFAAGRATARFGDRAVLVFGLVVLVVALLLRLVLNLNTPILLLVPLIALTSMGGAIVATPQTTILMSSAPTDLGGVVSAVKSSVAATAYSLGAALVSLVGVSIFLRVGNEELAGTGVDAAQARDTLRVAHGASAAGTPGTGLIDPVQNQWVVSQAAHAMIDTIHVLSLIMTVVPVIAIAAALVLLRDKGDAPLH